MYNLFKYILIILGECLLIAVLYVLFFQTSPELFALNTAALTCAYLANIFGYPSFTRHSDTEESESAGYGISWLGIWLYTAVVIISVAAFYWLNVPLIWQVMAQCLWLLLLLTSIYFGGMASRHAGHLEHQHRAETSHIALLKDRAHMLQASLPANMDDATRKSLTEVVERTGYLTASRSLLAATLEQEILDLLTNMERLLEQPGSPDVNRQLTELAQRCTLALKKRMALPY